MMFILLILEFPENIIMMLNILEIHINQNMMAIFILLAGMLWITIHSQGVMILYRLYIL